MVLKLPIIIVEKMSQHVLATYPEEGCGVLIGSKEKSYVVHDALPLKNVAAEMRNRRYRLDPLEFLKISKSVEANGHQVIGIFHSHPHHPSVPSEYDLNNAWPNLSYVILAIDGQKVKSIQSWRLEIDGGSRRFVEEMIEFQNANV